MISEAPGAIDSLGAFVPGCAPGGRVETTGAAAGPLAGLSFAAKDIYDVAGQVTGCGNPDWLRSHEPALRNAWAVQALLDAGARLVGKTITDELAYSLNGQNAHYGTPTNANAPGRIPGGSSSGSAAAVAGGVVPLALGSDTGGSIRIPASYCGLFGLRPSHGRIRLDGVMALAPSFDTVGWFTRDGALLRRVGEVLLDAKAEDASLPEHLILAEDAFDLAEAPLRASLAPLMARLEARLGPAERKTVGEAGGGLAALMLHFRHLQAREIWHVHGDWISATKPSFGPEVAERFALVQTVDEAAAEAAQVAREAMTQALEDMLQDGVFLCLPTAPGIAPLIDTTESELREHRARVLSLTCIAGLAGLPQVTMPLARLSGCPVGLSLIGPRGSDMALLKFAEAFAVEAGTASDPLYSS